MSTTERVSFTYFYLPSIYSSIFSMYLLRSFAIVKSRVHILALIQQFISRIYDKIHKCNVNKCWLQWYSSLYCFVHIYNAVLTLMYTCWLVRMSIHSYSGPIMESLRKNNLMFKFLMHFYQRYTVIGSTNENFIVSTNPKVCWKAMPVLIVNNIIILFSSTETGW